MDITVLREYLPLYATAALVTLRIAALGIALAMGVGLVCAAVRYSRIPVARTIVGGYIELSRNTPLVVQLFFLYFGLPKVGIVLSSSTCAIIGLGFLGGSYMAEALRSGLESVGESQRLSAFSLGMTVTQTLTRVIVPQGIATAIPGLVANVIFLVKETSVVSIIALPDLVQVAKDRIGVSYNTSEALFLLVVFYALILLPIMLGAMWLERRLRRASV